MELPTVVSRATFCHYPAWPAPVEVPLTTMPQHACPYLPGRVERARALWAEEMPADLYEEFMDAGFRRSGKLIYQPICRGCRECRPIRVPVDRFKPSKSQRRRRRRNGDLTAEWAEPAASDEKFELYNRYQREWHGKPEPTGRDEFEAFLYHSPVQSLEFCYRDERGKLLAVGICDVGSRSLSSVYFYFDPAESHRGLGTLGALVDLEFAQQRGLPFYYLGYWIRDCQAMRYKADYRPCELLDADGVWRAFEIVSEVER